MPDNHSHDHGHSHATPQTAMDARRFLRLNAYAEQPDPAAASDTLSLPFDLRCKTRWMVTLASGREALLMLPRGRIMRGGDQLVAPDGTRVNVQAAPEQLAHVTVAPGPEQAKALARVAYHLGNRHVAVEVGEGYLRMASDAVLENMVRGLGAQVGTVQAAFEPEGGAYSGGHQGHDHHDHHDHSQCGHEHHAHEGCNHDHGHGDHGHGHHGGSAAKIHDFSHQTKPA